MIMQIKPIKTEADYEAALKEIEQLWGSNYGSPEGDKLDVLATLVEVYEEEHYPILLKTDNSDKYPKVPSPKRSGGRLEHENLQVPETITYPQGKLKK